MPKTLKMQNVPPQPPAVDLTRMTQAEHAAFVSQLSDDPHTWRWRGRMLKGVPWWIETSRPYFTANEIMLVYGMKRRTFMELHESGVIPGSEFLPATGEQKKAQPVVRVSALVARVAQDGINWLLAIDRSPAQNQRRRGRRPGPLPIRTRDMELTREQFLGIAHRTFKVPPDVRRAFVCDDKGRTTESITFGKTLANLCVFATEEPLFE